jgi:hypothetical protein
VGKITGPQHQSFSVGKPGNYTVGADNTALLGPPTHEITARSAQCLKIVDRRARHGDTSDPPSSPRRPGLPSSDG